MSYRPLIFERLVYFTRARCRVQSVLETIRALLAYGTARRSRRSTKVASASCRCIRVASRCTSRRTVITAEYLQVPQIRGHVSHMRAAHSKCFSNTAERNNGSVLFSASRFLSIFAFPLFLPSRRSLRLRFFIYFFLFRLACRKCNLA